MGLSSILFLHPWMNGDHLARTVLKTVLADDKTTNDSHNVSERGTIELIWEKTNIKTKVQVVYIAVATSFV